jgi:hypothetical protein
MNNIPEEIEAMAFLIGQSNQIDSMMIDKPSTLVTSSETLKQGMSEYLSQQRRYQNPQPTAPHLSPQFTPPPAHFSEPIQNGPSPQLNTPPPQTSNNDQLEFNFEPKQGERIIDLLKEISLKLTKQQHILQKIYENKSSKDTITNLPVEPLDDSR